MLELISQYTNYTLMVVAGGAALLGAICGMVGTLTVLRRHGLVTDALAHACMPGVIIAFMITGLKSQSIFIVGAIITGAIVLAQMYAMINKLKFKIDSTLSLLLSVYFGFGIVLMSYIQNRSGYSTAGLESFFYGQAATMLIGDVKVIASLAGIIFIVLLLFWKDIIVVIFDPFYARSVGLSVGFVEILISLMLIATVGVGIQTAGVILISALIITPAAAARQWTNSTPVMIVLATLIGALSGLGGSIASNYITKMPTGPAIVVCAGVLTIISVFMAPKRGLLWKMGRERLVAKHVEYSMVMDTILLLSLKYKNTALTFEMIKNYYPKNKGDIEEILTTLAKRDFAEVVNGSWVLTERGMVHALENRSKHKGRAKFEVIS